MAPESNGCSSHPDVLFDKRLCSERNRQEQVNRQVRRRATRVRPAPDLAVRPTSPTESVALETSRSKMYLKAMGRQ